MMTRLKVIFLLISISLSSFAQNSITSSPERTEGEGPFQQLVIRGATLINGTGAPPIGPVDILVENNIITRIKVVGYPGLPIEKDDEILVLPSAKVIDAKGKYVLPGFVDMHGHIGGVNQGTPAEYVFKLWMAHGITTIRDPSAGNGIDWTLDHKKKSAENKITAPRIYAYTAFGAGSKNGINSPEEAITWARKNAEKGADGIKFFGD